MSQLFSNSQRYLTAQELAQKAGQIIIHARTNNDFTQEYKSHQELVTSTDKQVDEFLIHSLQQAFPEDQFLTEESYTPEHLETLNLSNPTWVIDPIDGTVNFAHGHPQVAISIAFVESDEVKFGIVHCPFLNETFYGIKGEGAYLNEQKISINDCLQLSQALIATGLPYDKSQIDSLLPNISSVIQHARDIRRNGSAAIDLCWVACGRLHAYYETVQPWDMAAGRLIAKEAGAYCGHFGTQKPTKLIPDLSSNQLLICSPGIQTALSNLLQ
ncbi:inositol monophosphatase family protein [Litoribrevibacter euphylliae]|uniref:Inositol-1-monophosphatase n=1 Tax=Litoribrevibacter euphylliae TaxID=1834034 RepID=A0ABV7HBF3_9GAMM